MKRLAEQCHVAVPEGMTQQEPVGYAPSQQRGKETASAERTEQRGTYPKERCQPRELGKSQTTDAQTEKGVKQVDRRAGTLVAAEQEVERRPHQQRHYPSDPQPIQCRTGSHQQIVEGGLYRGPHTYQGKRVVHPYQQATDASAQQQVEQQSPGGRETAAHIVLPKWIACPATGKGCIGQQQDHQQPPCQRDEHCQRQCPSSGSHFALQPFASVSCHLACTSSSLITDY